MTTNPEVFLRIPAHNTPNYSDPPDANRFYAALGMLSVAWGRLEGHASGNVLTIMTLLGRPQNRAVLFPWDARIKVWNEGFFSLPNLKPHHERAIAFMLSVKTAAEDRNFATHAIWQEFESNAVEPTMTARWLREKKKSPGSIEVEVDDRRITLSMVNAALAECNRLNLDMVEFTKLISAQRPPLDHAVRL
jgi:hypothetical protein